MNLQRLQNLTEILELKENNRQKILDFMSHAPCLCFMKSVETGKYEFVNKEMCESIGKSESQIIGRTDIELFSLQDAQLHSSYDMRVLKDKKPIVYITKRNGRIFLLTKFLVVNGQESIGGIAIELPSLFTLDSKEGSHA